MKNTNRPARRRILAIGIPVAALLIGVGIGNSAAGGVPEARVETKIETREVEVPVEKIVEKKVDVPVTPAACIAALDEAEALNQINIEAFGVVADMFDAASSFDVSGMNAGSAELDALQPKVASKVADYNEEATACRAN